MSRIRSITKKPVNPESLWNLAVECDESYIANGVAVHNCRSLLIPITRFEEWQPDKVTNGGQNVDKFLEKNVTDKGFSVYSHDGCCKPKEKRKPEVTDAETTFVTEFISPTEERVTYRQRGESFQVTTVVYADETKKAIKHLDIKRLDDETVL